MPRLLGMEQDRRERRAMYTKLLWATDASDGAEAALQEGLRLLAPGGKLIAFHSDQRFAGGRAGGLPVLADEDERQRRLQARVDELIADGIDAELVIGVTHHSPAHGIVEAAEEAGVDAIVCGTRGLGGVHGALLGSVSKELLHHAHVPVVVVPPRVPARVS
jgi:nucleotide-binding universal stress UspA family protein